MRRTMGPSIDDSARGANYAELSGAVALRG